MVFRSLSNHPGKFTSPAGHSTYKEYTRSKDEKGIDCLVCGCEHSIPDELAAAARGCNIESIVRRAGLGDPNAVLPVTDDMFGDITAAPKNLIEAELSIIRAKERFDSLPVALKQRYNNNPSEFLKSIEDGSYSKYIASKVTDSPSLTQAEIEALKKMVGDVNA